MKNCLDESVTWPKKKQPAKIVYSDDSHNSTIQTQPRRTLRSSRKNTSNEAIEKEPSRISLRNRTVDRSSFFNQSSKSTNPNIKDKDNQSLIKHNSQNKDKKLLYKQIIQDRPDLPRN